MNMSSLLMLGAGYLLGNPQARDKFGTMLQELAGYGIDALNDMNKTPIYKPANNGGENVAEQPFEN